MLLTLITAALLAADAPVKKEDPRLIVAFYAVEALQAERDEAIAEGQRLAAQARKERAVAALEAAKKLLPGWYEGAPLSRDFTIAPKPKEEPKK